MRSVGDQAPIVVDTVVFGAGLTSRTFALAARYAPLLVGHQLLITVQTVTELYFGAYKARWGDARRRRLEQRLSQAGILPCDEQLARTCAELRLACLQQGHPLAHKIHTNDLWVAAAAVHYAIPLVSDDHVFSGAPGLQLRTAPRTV